MMPLSPSTMTSRVSAAVGASNAILPQRPCSIWLRTHSAPVRVLPNPRPAKSIQMRQSPAGSSCSGRAQNVQS